MEASIIASLEVLAAGARGGVPSRTTKAIATAVIELAGRE
jgi:hypothetical protein